MTAFSIGRNAYRLAVCALSALGALGCLNPRGVEHPVRPASAELDLAAKLDAANLTAASLAMLEPLATNQAYSAHAAALTQLLGLAGKLPAASHVQDTLAMVPARELARGLAELSEPELSHVHYLLGIHAYEARDPTRALSEFERVRGLDQARADLWMAVCYLRQRKAVPTARVLEQALKLVFGHDDPESRRIADQAHLFLAELYYSAAIRLNLSNRSSEVDRRKLSFALENWWYVRDSGPLGSKIPWQRAWANYMRGDFATALADLDASRARDAYAPEAGILRGLIYWAKGELAQAHSSFEGTARELAPVAQALAELDAELARDTAGAPITQKLLADVAANRIRPELRVPLRDALTTRDVEAALAYLREIERETDALAQLRLDSARSDQVRGALVAAHAAAESRLARLVEGHVQFEMRDVTWFASDARSALYDLAAREPLNPEWVPPPQ
ncbi:MAG TPA: hypothetical protein VGM29_12160 [Polyangiaceae bacterium]